MPNSIMRVSLVCAALALLGACATTGGSDTGSTGADSVSGEASLAEKLEREIRGASAQGETARPAPAREEPAQPVFDEGPARTPSPRSLQTMTVRGDGQFVNTRAATRPRALETAQGEVTLNFELADIRDVVKVIFDTLGQNYILDPAVQGEVTVQTSRPLPKDLLLPTLETLLRQVGAALVRSEGTYRIVPTGRAIAGANVPRLGAGGPGYEVRIFPLRYISAPEMETILQPFAPEGGILLVDPVRNLIILAGTRQELNYLQETINIFDVNWLKGMSVGFYPLSNVDAQDVAQELSGLFGPDSGLPFAGLFRFVPIVRMNAILVITPQPEYLNEATVWIERLDESGGERLYVYKVQNGDAEYLASLLGDIFDTETGSAARSSTSGRVAPGLQPGQISSNRGDSVNLASFQAIDEEQARGGAPPQSSVPSAGGRGGRDENTRVIADTENNALLIWASAQQYERMLGALRQIDVPKRQVLIEATIAEVSLTDDLRYGLQWFFNNSVGDGYTGSGSLNLGNNTTLDDLSFENFTYAITNSAGLVRALLNVLAQESKVRVLSSPQLMVVDNQEARIQVGDQVPVLTGTTTTDGGNVTQSIQFKDTGVILQVRPRINASGLVSLELTQEVTDVGQSTVQGTDQLPFLKREIATRVAAQSGDTIVLGGLIRENRRSSSGGIPGLHTLPVVGGLFGNKGSNYDRTELVILLTPQVINNSNEASQTAAELRERMRGIVPLESPWKRQLQPPDHLGLNPYVP